MSPSGISNNLNTPVEVGDGVTVRMEVRDARKRRGAGQYRGG